MSVIDQKLSNILSTRFVPIDPEQVKKAFNSKLETLGYGVEVTRVSVDIEGNQVVEFTDFEGDQLLTVWLIDEYDNGSAKVMIIDEEPDDEDSIEIILDMLEPTIIPGDFGNYIDLQDLYWLNKQAMETILTAGDIDDNTVDFEELGEGILSERAKVIVRNGKKQKVALVRRVKKVRLTPKQKQGIRKAVRSRAKKATQSKRKRARSLKIRKRSGIKSQKRRPGEKISFSK